MNLCGFEVGPDKPLFLIAGPCVIESEQLALDTAGQLKSITTKLGIPFIYKSSFDKANRTSVTGHRGPGIEEGQRKKLSPAQASLPKRCRTRSSGLSRLT